MKILLPIILFVLLVSCAEEEVDKSDPALVGSWQLIETRSHPGDLSGVFEPVESGKIVVFSTEGTFTSNGDLCRSSTNSNSPSSGTYDKESKTIKVSDCDNFDLPTGYGFENENLILSGFACIEGCSEKYTRID